MRLGRGVMTGFQRCYRQRIDFLDVPVIIKPRWSGNYLSIGRVRHKHLYWYYRASRKRLCKVDTLPGFLWFISACVMWSWSSLSLAVELVSAVTRRSLIQSVFVCFEVSHVSLYLICIYLHFLFDSLYCIFYNVIFLDYFHFRNPAATAARSSCKQRI